MVAIVVCSFYVSQIFLFSYYKFEEREVLTFLINKKTDVKTNHRSK